MELEQNKKVENKVLSWKVLLPVGILLWAIGRWALDGTVLGASANIIGLIIAAVGIVRLITHIIGRKK